MKAYIILLLCGLSALGLQAQNLQFRVGGGLASHYGKAQNVGAFKVGLGYEFEFDQHWTLTPSLAVYGKGWKDPNQLVYVFDDAGNQLFDEETGEPLQGVRVAAKERVHLGQSVGLAQTVGQACQVRVQVQRGDAALDAEEWLH